MEIVVDHVYLRRLLEKFPVKFLAFISKCDNIDIAGWRVQIDAARLTQHRLPVLILFIQRFQINMPGFRIHVDVRIIKLLQLLLRFLCGRLCGTSGTSAAT